MFFFVLNITYKKCTSFFSYYSCYRIMSLRLKGFSHLINKIFCFISLEKNQCLQIIMLIVLLYINRMSLSVFNLSLFCKQNFNILL